MRRFVRCVALAVSLWLSGGVVAQEHSPSRVEIAWNRYYTLEEVEGYLRALADAYPELMTLERIGTSGQGRPVWMVTINNSETGDDRSKPAMYIDGSVHANEVQATEVVLYTIWYLLKSYGTNERLTALVDRCAFYLVPVVNPDGRRYWFEEANTPHSSRRNQRPVDDDRDGAVDEDGPDDLDGDGHITQMWKADPSGRWIRDRVDPRIFRRVAADEPGEWTRLGSEGIDNDGDGRVNEDGPFGDDMNRNWPSDWLPNHIQRGAGLYPFSAPETRCIGEFIVDHPNIAGSQSYHNTGGMILRGPGASYRGSLYARDRRVYDEIARTGEQMLPYYRYLIIHEDLYTVHGGFVTWMSEHLGVISFTNELWSWRKYFQRGDARPNEEQTWLWRDKVAFGELFTDYKEFEHPQYGTVLIGGPNKWSSRSTPTFMLEEECHRNFAFTMFHADAMPLVSIDRIGAEDLGGGLWQVTAQLRNERLIPTRTALQREKRIGSDDVVSCSGDGVTVIAGGRVSNWWDTTMDAARHEPDRLRLADGVGSLGTELVRFIVEGRKGARVRIRFAGERVKDVERAVVLE